MRRTSLVLAVAAIALTACVRTSVMPMSANTFQITARAAPICGGEGAERVAFRRAAIETIRQGYDRFMIVNGLAQNNVSVGTYVYGNRNGVYSSPIFYGSHDQAVIVRTFRDNEPEARNALSARAVLGPTWQEQITSNTMTCTDSSDRTNASYSPSGSTYAANSVPEPAPPAEESLEECRKSEEPMMKWARANNEKFVSRCKQ
jgi:hypothetical protein